MNTLINILNTQFADIDIIFLLYNDAIAYQKKVGNNNWLGFERSLIEHELQENRHFKILMGDVICGTFCITRDDALIWQGNDQTPAIYIHRIAISEHSRGNNLLIHIINWAKAIADKEDLKFIRMDTGAGNDRLINYYIKCGFRLMGTTTVKFEPGMPEHYKDGVFALLEMAV